jgi:hypothetical protein
MTPFQQAAISIVTHAWCKEFSKPDDKISGRPTTVESRSGKYMFNFDIYELSYSGINLMENSSKLRFYSEKMEKNNFIMVSEDVSYLRIGIYEVLPQYRMIRGADSSRVRFEARVDTWYEVLIEDDENRHDSPFLYRLKY